MRKLKGKLTCVSNLEEPGEKMKICQEMVQVHVEVNVIDSSFDK